MKENKVSTIQKVFFWAFTLWFIDWKCDNDEINENWMLHLMAWKLYNYIVKEYTISEEIIDKFEKSSKDLPDKYRLDIKYIYSILFFQIEKQKIELQGQINMANALKKATLSEYNKLYKNKVDKEELKEGK